MSRSYLPLNSLRAFEAAARHLSLTKAAIELNVTHAAISQQVRSLEERLRCRLFIRISRGLKLTPEGESLLPVLNYSFDNIAEMLDRFGEGQQTVKLKIGAVGTYLTGFLLHELQHFQSMHPYIELIVSSNNNRVDLTEEGLDFAVRYGRGAWHSTNASFLCDAPLTPLCTPEMLCKLRMPIDLLKFPLLRSCRRDEWAAWFQLAGEQGPPPGQRIMIFDSSVTMIQAALSGAGVALAPAAMFRRQLRDGSLCRPFPQSVDLGGYCLTSLQSRVETSAMQAFSAWLIACHTRRPCEG